jgi:hypothetical protein
VCAATPDVNRSAAAIGAARPTAGDPCGGLEELAVAAPPADAGWPSGRRSSYVAMWKR